MNKPLTVLTVAGAMAALAAPAAAKKPDATAKVKVPSAQSQCRTEKDGMGASTFAMTYGTNASHKNAFGKCVSKRNAATREARKAAKGDAGKTAKTVKAQVKADVNAAKTCKAARQEDETAFSEQWGGKRNAFGKCVSATARKSGDSES
jgi:hypothetical protein